MTQRGCRGLLVGVVVLAAGCPYMQRDGEFSAGAVDPASFPPAYVGVGGDRLRPGRGTFTEVRAYANNKPIGYYAFPFSTSQVGPPAPPTGFDPLKVIDNSAAVTRVPTPLGYRFLDKCKPPDGYRYDPRLDEIRYDQQGDIFTALPTATYPIGSSPTWSYIPVLREATVSGALDCQSVKSEETLLERTELKVTSTGNYLARAVIDVAAAVYRVGDVPGMNPGVGTQRLGWYNHYLTAYIDGGTIPTTKPDEKTVRLQTQALYIPRNVLISGKSATGATGQGYDVLDAGRGEAGYSPVCAVFVYNTGSTVLPPDQLPRDVATIMAKYNSMSMPITPASTPYIYCLQVE